MYLHEKTRYQGLDDTVMPHRETFLQGSYGYTAPEVQNLQGYHNLEPLAEGHVGCGEEYQLLKLQVHAVNQYIGTPMTNLQDKRLRFPLHTVLSPLERLQISPMEEMSYEQIVYPIQVLQQHHPGLETIQPHQLSSPTRNIEHERPTFHHTVNITQQPLSTRRQVHPDLMGMKNAAPNMNDSGFQEEQFHPVQVSLAKSHADQQNHVRRQVNHADSSLHDNIDECVTSQERLHAYERTISHGSQLNDQNDERMELPHYADRQQEQDVALPVLPPCRVCGDRSTGFHYGATTCEACKVNLKKSSLNLVEARQRYIKA